MYSPIYKNIFLYRLVMNVLYQNKYCQRYNLITSTIANLKPNSVLELCFGDTIIADFCKVNKINWTGIDASSYFVKRAISNKHNAIEANILTVSAFPKTDLVIISGSLYQFHNYMDELLVKMFAASKQILIAEPVQNLSTKKGLIGALAAWLTSAGKGAENFRYTKISLKKLLEEKSHKFNYSYKYIGNFKRDDYYLLTKYD